MQGREIQDERDRVRRSEPEVANCSRPSSWAGLARFQLNFVVCLGRSVPQSLPRDFLTKRARHPKGCKRFGKVSIHVLRRLGLALGCSKEPLLTCAMSVYARVRALSTWRRAPSRDCLGTGLVVLRRPRIGRHKAGTGSMGDRRAAGSLPWGWLNIARALLASHARTFPPQLALALRSLSATSHSCHRPGRSPSSDTHHRRARERR
jgi:hypothetical protein